MVPTRRGDLVELTNRVNRPMVSHGIDRLDDSLIDNTVLPDGGAIAGANYDDMTRAQMVTISAHAQNDGGRRWY